MDGRKDQGDSITLWTLVTPLSGEVKAELVKSDHLLHKILIKKRLLPKARGSLTPRDPPTPSQEKPRLRHLLC